MKLCLSDSPLLNSYFPAAWNCYSGYKWNVERENEINAIKIEKKIAQIIIDDAANQISINWTENSYFTKRRSDFQGLILNGLTDEEGSSITLNSNYHNLSKTFDYKNSSYFNVTGYVSGIYYEVLQLLLHSAFIDRLTSPLSKYFEHKHYLS